uniref:Uncharacterized protein n=1 Tax=Daphnia magna TaxID=35525 RepID=A0A0P5VX02_9CRUS
MKQNRKDNKKEGMDQCFLHNGCGKWKRDALEHGQRGGVKRVCPVRYGYYSTMNPSSLPPPPIRHLTRSSNELEEVGKESLEFPWQESETSNF